ncbi:MAG TPA: argininosuccinate lyase [Elusimicrobiota bacterium]|nr:argininosuccinate lyase [Elusimicrobiota bacterium]
MKKAPVSPSDFVASYGFDHRLAPHDIVASMAHVEMLGRQRILSRAEAAKIVAGLKKLLARVNAGGRLLKTEDVHFSIEKSLYAEIGPLAGKMHTARSRNDQTVTALRMYLRERIDGLRERLRALELSFVGQAEKNIDAIMPGYTHLQPGQPISAAQHLLAYAWMFRRDRERLVDLRRRVNRLPLGAAALAGTTFPIDRAWVARKLEFDGAMENSIDAVSDRDFLVEFLAAGALIMTHLSRWAEELIVWSNPSFGFVALADPFITGSSIMPQKRNPDMAELLRGKTGRVVGSLNALLTLLKGTPLAYNRDLQEDKPPVFDAVDTLEACLDVSIPMAQTLKLHPDRTKAACRLGFLLATDVADALARRGLPFREAHALVGRVVAECLKTNRTLEDLTVEDWKIFSPLFGPWVTGVLNVEDAVAARRSLGGTAPGEIRRQIAALRKQS